MLASTGTRTSLFGWAGEARDGTGLVFLRARYYSPSLGRFFVRDSWPGNQQMPGTLHPYLYGFNNPILYIDPSGECVDPLTLMLCGAVIGAGVGFIGSFATQAYNNYQNNGGDLWSAVSAQNIDWGQVGLASATGAVVGAALPAASVLWVGTTSATTLAVAETAYIAATAATVSTGLDYIDQVGFQGNKQYLNVGQYWSERGAVTFTSSAASTYLSNGLNAPANLINNSALRMGWAGASNALATTATGIYRRWGVGEDPFETQSMMREGIASAFLGSSSQWFDDLASKNATQAYNIFMKGRLATYVSGSSSVLRHLRPPGTQWYNVINEIVKACNSPIQDILSWRVGKR